jgi:hypothetical protein
MTIQTEILDAARRSTVSDKTIRILQDEGGFRGPGDRSREEICWGSIREAADRGRLARYLYLERLDVLSLPALGAFGDLELDSLAFLQTAEAARLDG